MRNKSRNKQFILIPEIQYVAAALVILHFVGFLRNSYSRESGEARISSKTSLSEGS
jgi:hypothetical protein